MASSKDTANRPTVNSRATAPRSTEAIPNRDTEAAMEDRPRAGTEGINSRLRQRGTVLVLVAVRRWGWAGVCWVV